MRLKKARAKKQLSATSLQFKLPASYLPFTTTAKLDPLHESLGQDRAIQSFKIGLNLMQDGYNIFATGMQGVKKLGWVSTLVEDHLSKDLPIPGDRVYVYNFRHPDEPVDIVLEPGQSRMLSEDMESFVDMLENELPEAFQNEKFEKEKRVLAEGYHERIRSSGEALEKKAEKKDLSLQRTESGEFFFVPVLEGEVIKNPEDYNKLPGDVRNRYEENQREMLQRLKEFMTEQQGLIKELSRKIKKIERDFTRSILTPLIDGIRKNYSQPKVHTYLNQVLEHSIQNLESFKSEEAPAPAAGPAGRKTGATRQDRFIEYRINILVDNSELTGPPVIVETSPTYKNLFGSIERVVDSTGKLVTNFTRIKAGQLVRADGGVLVINLEDAIYEPNVWRWLLRTLKNNSISMDVYDPFSMFTVAGLKPYPMDIRVKVILVGSPQLYHVLYAQVPDFKDIFRIRADFTHEMPFTKENAYDYARQLAWMVIDEKLPNFSKKAVERLLEFSARRAGDRNKLLAQFHETSDLAREAAFWCRDKGANRVSETHVQQALDERRFRRNRYDETMRDAILQDTIMIETEGKKTGQINGLAVLSLPGYAFGKPSRITVAVGKGLRGIINIEREAKLSGRIHDKGVLILTGYLTQMYGQTQAIQLNASLTFEQNYGGVDGDSASSTELYALLSAIANIPLRQDLAVTGSVNQKGEIQAIGGVNEKIEGFYQICKERGLSGTQGVMIPVSNVKNLVLSYEVIEAVKKGTFHIYPIATLDDGLELLSGVKAGTIEEECTFHYQVLEGLKRLAPKQGKAPQEEENEQCDSSEPDSEEKKAAPKKPKKKRRSKK